RWEGRYIESAETGPFQVQVIPQGKGSYQLWVRMGEAGSRYQVQGARENDRLVFQGRFQVVSGTDDAAYELTGEISGNRLTGSFDSPEGSGRIELARVARAQLVPTPRPEGAVQLFDGTNLAGWRRADGGPVEWRLLSDGSMVAAGTDLVTRDTYSGFRLHVEFLLPLLAEARGQERANSGIIVAGLHEVHILDSFGEEPTKGGCGAIFGVAAPRLDACLPPLEWQAFDITLRAPAVDAAGRQAQGAEITVELNGVPLHDRLQLKDFRRAPLRLRSGGGGVRFRNIWIQPLAN
ncbi:MAG: DUF1080 domain-containing protein, partial [Opitutae bacterium]|nr:DUF1080 domain-containing protein [Opitutae bacterium]